MKAITLKLLWVERPDGVKLLFRPALDQLLYAFFRLVAMMACRRRWVSLAAGACRSSPLAGRAGDISSAGFHGLRRRRLWPLARLYRFAVVCRLQCLTVSRGFASPDSPTSGRRLRGSPSARLFIAAHSIISRQRLVGAWAASPLIAMPARRAEMPGDRREIYCHSKKAGLIEDEGRCGCPRRTAYGVAVLSHRSVDVLPCVQRSL